MSRKKEIKQEGVPRQIGDVWSETDQHGETTYYAYRKEEGIVKINNPKEDQEKSRQRVKAYAEAIKILKQIISLS